MASAVVLGITVLSAGLVIAQEPKIDREAVVRRHDPVLHKIETRAPLTVGNGNFAFTVDVTGLQTFEDLYHADGIQLETFSNWAWHSFPNPEGFKLEDSFRQYDVHGRQVGFPTNDGNPAGKWLRANPHRFPLGVLGFEMTDAGKASEIDQRLELWTGTITSKFKLDGQPVEVVTVAHPERDLVAVKISSPLLANGALKPVLRFPYAHDPAVKNNPPINWGAGDKHKTSIATESNGAAISREAQDFKYTVKLAWTGGAKLAASEHRAEWTGIGDAIEIALEFAPGEAKALPSFDEVKSASAAGWKQYWSSGGAIDFAGSSDPRAAELERRIVLSQYLERVQTAGDVPPQETGLTVNTWHGKQHTEMTWWNTAHYFLWGRPALAERSMAWYQTVLPAAKATAAQRGFTGAAWSKMVGIDGRESPGGNPFILWNQPHIIHMAELARRANPAGAEKYKELVFETAEYLASFAYFEKAKDRYVLGPPLWLAQEIYPQAQSQNPTYELAYWRWALATAQEWRERAGMPREAHWDDVIAKLSKLPVKDGKYVGLESIPDTWEKAESRQDHPSMLMALGFLPPSPLTDEATMRTTLDAVVKDWQFDAKIWGWDFPMMAMTAARIGQPERALDLLLMDHPHNTYSTSGQAYQREDLPMYLPANGSLLSAVAMMAAGWDGSTGEAPGFPKTGWKVKWEGLEKLP